METWLLITSATVAGLITVPLLIRMHQKGLSLTARLYVAVFSGSLILLCQTAITGNRPLGYFPEVVVSVSVAIGLIAAFISAYSEHPERQSVFRSLF